MLETLRALLDLFVFILFLKFLDSLLKGANLKGKWGERVVCKRLEGLTEDYNVINDVIVPNGDYTSQIDHLVISKYGIFVIETKNYSGKIYGSQYSSEWTEYLKGKPYKFMNPINQNYGHIKALSEYLSIDEERFYPIIVFLSNADIRVKETVVPVIHTNKILSTIKSHKEVVFTDEQVNLFTNKINELDGKYSNAEHIDNIYQKATDEEDLAAQMICPKCGSKLVERNGKYGKFLGCSNYPKCRYTKDIDTDKE